MTEQTESIDEATEIFNLCSKPECPRDIRFDCENLIDYAEAKLLKSRKEQNIARREHVHKLLSLHLIENISKSESSRKTKFRCIVCQGKPLSSIADCILHLSGSSHQNLEHLDTLNYTVQHIPEPSEEHCISVGRTIYQVVGKHVISDSEIRRRERVIELLNDSLQMCNTGCTLDLYGSSVTGLGFQESDINVSAFIPDSAERPIVANEALQKLISFLQNHPKLVKLSQSPISNVANLVLANDEKLDNISLQINDINGVKMTQLFSKYVSLFPMVQPLVVAFRLWAKLCKVDCAKKEGMPPHAFVSMVIYFLQRENILPVLDPGIISCKTSDDEEMRTADTLSPGRLGYLWIKLLRFYSNEDFFVSTVISISEKAPVTKEQKRWNERKLAVADPITPSLNLSRKAMSNNRMCEYMVDRLKHTYVYFGVPRTTRGTLYDLILPSERKDICAPYVFHRLIPRLVPSSDTKHGHESMLDKIDDPKWNPIKMAEELRGTHYSSSLNFSFTLESVKARMFTNHQNLVSVLVEDASLLEHIFPDWLYQYKFDEEIIGIGEEPPTSCKGCSSKHHFIADCPLEVLPYTPLSSTKASVDTSCILNEVLGKNYEKDKLSSNDVAVRQSILSSVKSAVSHAFPNLSLQLFGSSVNGFGTNRSDVDISLEFSSDDDRINEQLTLLAKMARIRNILYKMEEFKIIYFARNARIPVVKFIHLPTNIEGDLSASNNLAVHNSQLLRMYAEIDPRVKIIGCFLKKLVKICDISEASKASLSSYGYTLMVIHFMQQLKNPILPVLHELPHDGFSTPSAEGWKLHYFSDMENLKQVWPALGQNRQSLSELWLELLTYYTSKFSFEDHVITVRQLKPLSRLTKFWLTDSLIAIEDPFILSHNIGQHLSRKMCVHILKTFRKFYELFHLNYDSTMLGAHKNWLSYFTDASIVRDGRPPMERHHCYICRHIGHTGRNCPERSDKKRKISEVGEDEKDFFPEKKGLKTSDDDDGVKNGRN